MSDLRHDPIDDIWVAIAGNRRSRPMEFVPLEQMRQRIICPFCKGNESETPQTLAAYDQDGCELPTSSESSNWLTRVVANKYPSFSTIDGEADQTPQTAESRSLDGSPFEVAELPGVQELIIPSPRHVASMGELTGEEVRLSFRVHQRRVDRLRGLRGICHAMLFMNCRSAAGASLEHIHWQLIGSPLVSGHLQRRADRNQQHLDEHGRTWMHRLVAWELEQEQRILIQTDRFVVLCPFASRYPFQMHVVPRFAESFPEASASDLDELADHVQRVVKQLESLLDFPAYNVLLQTPAFDRIDRDSWYLEIFPRLTTPAGFERGTDIWVNPVAPETAARALRVAAETRVASE